MPSIDFELDTMPMAKTLDGISGHVVATTVAVTAMESAVIKAEKDAADRVCQNVDRGFFNLIQSQISSKLAKHFTEMSASFNLLMQYSKSLAAIGNRMETDVFRLKRQYYKIFHGLDKSLENRVTQLDRDAMKLGDMRQQLIMGRSLKNVANTLCSEKECSVSNQMLITARLKERTSSALSAISNTLYENGEYLNGVSRMLFQGDPEGNEVLYIPVICVEEQSQNIPDTSLSHVFYPEYLSQQTRGTMERKINSSAAKLLETVGSSIYDQHVQAEFQQLTASSGLDERTIQVMMSLFHKGEAV